MFTVSRSGAGKTVPIASAAEKSVRIWTHTRAPPSGESSEDTAREGGWRAGGQAGSAAGLGAGTELSQQSSGTWTLEPGCPGHSASKSEA